MSTPQALEQTLIARAQRGNGEAVAELYRAHVQAIYRYMLCRVGEASTAEDLTSDVFFKALEGLNRYQVRGSPFAAWLFRIARDRVSDHYRRQAHRPVAELPDSLADPSEGLESAYGQKAEAAELHARLRELTGDQHDVIHWHFVEGLSIEDTATVLGKTPGAVKALQHRALKALARKLA